MKLTQNITYDVAREQFMLKQYASPSLRAKTKVEAK